jgi:hypothetical protein
MGHSPVTKHNYPLAQSPTVTEQKEGLIDFPAAMQAVKDGNRITKKEWNDKKNNAYCAIHDGLLMLHKDDGVWYKWIVNDGDMFGEDWIVLGPVAQPDPPHILPPSNQSDNQAPVSE